MLVCECHLQSRETYQTPLRCMGPILTTWRVFSLFSMPSRRPRVIPATFRSLVPLIMWLSSRSQRTIFLRGGRPKITFTASNTDALGFNLETQAAFVLPQRSGHAGLHSRRGNLTSVVKSLGLIALRTG
jgi:hypothetical protein